MTTTAPSPTAGDAAPPPARPPRGRGPLRFSSAPSVGAILIKVVSLGLLDALVLYAVIVLVMHGDWVTASAALLGAAVINWIYLRRGLLPAKYLAPATVFLVIFQLYVIVYSGYIAFTNYGDGHVGDKDDAIAVLISKSLTRVPDSPGYDMVVVERLGELSFLVTDDEGQALIGNELRPLEPADGAEFEGGRAVALDGYTTLDFTQMIADQKQIAAMSVPLTDDLDDGALRTQDGATAFAYAATMRYDEATDSFVDLETGTVYADTGNGAFTSADGDELMPGWKIEVGFENFVRAFTDESIRGPLVGVIIWTFVFAGVTVAATFALGVFLAIMLDDRRLRFRRTFRVLIILPYAFPAFLSALIWSGLLNPQFGFINQVLLGGAEIPWLTDPFLAKVSVLWVNLWLTYPYLFLVATGALQAIPEEYIEAARVDGAGAWTVFRRVKLPLLMVTMAPLLIATFAYNFNNFNVIYLLTEGGPQDISTEMNVGATDILITLVYKVAFGETSGRDYGLASAFSIIIFILVATISLISFRRTKALEDLH
ncbi:ABC transporter permease subunit [Agromyces sp. MMS24-K17]|uniref:ABC transporter permease subunit n=1 Tax=Agromyces sp. MMS24-K17 TaxID=3372850 RepID=UPI003754DE2A